MRKYWQWLAIVICFIVFATALAYQGRISPQESALSASGLPQNPNVLVDYDGVELAEIWLAGGCFWGVEAYFARIYGVAEVTVGYANGHVENPQYQQVIRGDTGHAETIHVRYDPKRVYLETLLEHFFAIIDPTVLNRQGNDIGPHYRTGIYYQGQQDRDRIVAFVSVEQTKYTQPIVTEVLPLVSYYLAEEYHQQYLEKNPDGYCHVDFSLLQTVPIRVVPELYSRPEQDTIRAMLTDLQYYVTQEDGTELPHTNLYNDHFAPGIYVDVVTGEPLFSSRDKFASPSGWPSFSRPIVPEVVTYHVDRSYGMVRQEVRSRVGDSHLGHVFDDGPRDRGGLRYCINSASLEFISVQEMESSGYGFLLSSVLVGHTACPSWVESNISNTSH